MGKIAKKLDLSAATVHAQIHSHDESIEKAGYCDRSKGEHESEKTEDRTIDRS